MSTDFLPLKRIDHVEFYVGNAKQAAHYYRTVFGFTPTATPAALYRWQGFALILVALLLLLIAAAERKGHARSIR